MLNDLDGYYGPPSAARRAMQIDRERERASLPADSTSQPADEIRRDWKERDRRRVRMRRALMACAVIFLLGLMFWLAG